MGEIKSVKVDNWGVFFLQKLQNFFNKTDYCDLTLQFNDNSQLKVHKLVLSACTDYFNVLEQTCEMIDDILIMPNELQADLVVPIVNFMYTGTLEFELKMYGKLLKTARDMNMTVLLKLLEAHRRTMEGGTKQVVRNTKTYLNAGIKPTASIPTIIETSSGNTVQAKRRILSTKIEPYRKLQIKPISSTTYTDSNTILTRYPNTKIAPIKGPSRFEYEGENILQDTFESSFDTISYESKPLKEEILDDDDNLQKQPIKQESTTSLQFEQLRHTGYNNNKRPAQSILQSPPTKKPNIQDVKEYAEQQRMRKQIAEEYGEEFEDTLDDEFHNADDDEEYNISAPIKHQVMNKKLPTTSSNLRQKSQLNQINKKAIGLTTKQEEKPRIVVKDSTSSNVDHAKIISEVLRKYPHLIKNNKNIKLKIMPNASGNGGPQRVVIKKESDTNMSPVPSTSKTAMTTGIQEAKLLKFSPQQKVTTTTIAAQVQPSTVAASTTTAVAQSSSQPRRIDSKTMKALISLGAENTTGPWLCLRCGVNGRPISIPSYRGFRRHLINTHKEKIDARLCEHCGWRSTTQKELLFHMQMEHQIKCNINFPKCEHCNLVVLDLAALDDHIDEYHLENKEENQQCIYCNKTFSTEILLYNHMKAQHKERARDDGVIDFSDDEHTGEYVDDNDVDDSNNYEQESTNQKLPPPKIQILSDINLAKCISLTKSTDLPINTLQQEHTITTSDTTILSNIDYITTSTAEDAGPKFVNAEGNVMELTPAQRDEIISQLEQSGDGVVMVLNDESFVNDEKITDIGDSSTGKIQSITSQQFGDNNMLIVYDEQQTTITTTKTNEKIIKDNKAEKRPSKKAEEDVDEEMEWKNDVSQDEIEKETTEALENEENIKQVTNEKKEIEDISKIKKEEKDSSDLDMKLKLLTGDWTEDEDEDEEGQDMTDDTENRKNKTSGEDKILDILEKNNDSSDITGENLKTELKNDNVEGEIQQPHENDEENQTVSAKADDNLQEIETKKDHKVAETEENFESYTEDKDEEILFCTEIGSTLEEKTVEETEQKPNIDENDDNESVVTTITESVTKETTDNTAENVDNKEEKEENSEEVMEIKDSDKKSLHKDFAVNEERNDDDSQKDDKMQTVSISHDNIEELEKEEDENLNKSDKDNENDKLIAHATTTEIKDEIDELSQLKTKDEIKNLISEWGEDDDDL